MRRRRSLEFAVGGGLLLGPLVYALTLPQPSEATIVCEVQGQSPEVVVVEVCEQAPERVEPAEPEVEVEPERVEPEPEVEPEPGARVPFMFVSGKTLVLTTDADPSWGRGRLYQPPGAATFRVAKAADATQIPAALWSQRGREFDLYGPEGKVCTARIGKLHVVNQYDGWGLEGVIGEPTWDYESPKDIPKQLWREPLWDMDQGDMDQGHWLVGEIESDERCKGALWARDAALPAPEILSVAKHETGPAAQRLAMFKGSDQLEQLREDYQAWYAALPEEAHEWERDWATMSASEPATVRSWIDGAGAVRLVELDFGANQESCGDGFDARVTALEHVRGERFVDTERSAEPLAIFDADLDGELEYLYSAPYDFHVRLASETLEAELYVERDWECPC